MKTREEMEAMYNKKGPDLTEDLCDLVESNDIEGVKNFLKDYPVPEVFFAKWFDFWEKGNNIHSFLNPAVVLGAAGIAYDKSGSFAMMEYLESLGLQADYQYLSHNALTSYISQGGKNPKTIEYFKSKGATFEIYNQFGATPLHRWARDNDEAEALETALKAGANPNIKRGKRSDGEVDWNSIDSTPLYEATRYDEGEPQGACAKVLLKYGAEVNAVCYYLDEKTGAWAKIRSVLDGDLEGCQCPELLMKAGAKTWRQLVKRYNIDTNLELKEQYRIYNELLEKKGK